MRVSTLCAVVALALAALAGCGSNDNSETPPPASDGGVQVTGGEGTAPVGASASPCPPVPIVKAALVRATGVACGPARLLVVTFADSPRCSRQGSRSACTVRGYRCLAVRAGSGRSVSCARRGRSVSFVLPPA